MRKMAQLSSHFLLYSGALVINNQLIPFSHSTEPDRQKATGKEKVKPLLKLKTHCLERRILTCVLSLVTGASSRAVPTSAGQEQSQRACGATAGAECAVPRFEGLGDTRSRSTLAHSPARSCLSPCSVLLHH